MKKQIIYLLAIAATLSLSACNKDDGGIPSQDVSSHFFVERNKTEKTYQLSVTKEGDWDIYAGVSPTAINMTQKVASGSGTKTVTLSNYEPAKRVYFRYVWEGNSSTISSERLLPMDGAYNVRDLGGYRTVDKKSVKWGSVFRSGDLNKLTVNDLAYLSGVGIKTIVDFRDDAERAAAPDKTPSTCTQSYSYPIQTGSIINMAEVHTLADAEQLLVVGNKFFVTDCQQQYKDFFKVLINGGNTPVLFHCSAGKDRAGFASALFLASLGVELETIIKDYLLSGGYVSEKYAPYVAASPILAPVFETRREYIMAAFDTIDRSYGGVESFLKNQLGVDTKKMKALYTE